MDKTKKVFLGIGVLAAIAVITFAFAIAASGSDGGVIDQNAEGATVAASAVTSSINYQGRLTDSAGEPLSGTYDMTFRLYNVSSGGTVLDTDTHSVEVTDGLFNTAIGFDQTYFDGRELWFGIIAGGEEMSPRQEFKPVPYALSLRPGAKIISSGYPALHAESTHPSGRGIRGYATATSGTNFGVVGASKSPDGYGGYFYNNGGGTGVYGKGGKYGGYFTTDQGGTSWADSTAGVDVATTHDYSYGVIAETTGEASDGVRVYTHGEASDGVRAKTIGDHSYGVRTDVHGDNSIGVCAYAYGDNSEAVHAFSNNGCGVYGKGTEGGYFTTRMAGSSSRKLAGVNVSTAYNFNPGVRIETTGDYSVGVHASTSGDNSDGVVGRSASGTGVRGVSTDFEGVWGESTNHFGVLGHSSNKDAIFADTAREDHKYGVRTPDKMSAMSYDTSSSDVAEYFAVDEDVEAGTVMVIGEDSKLQRSTTAYDTTVAGIVSTAPGMSLGINEEGNEGEELIAVAGRVPCKVNATYAPIKPGDLLTTSDTPGHAMKATDPQIGTILGKALEPLDSGTGMIEVLVTLQ